MRPEIAILEGVDSTDPDQKRAKARHRWRSAQALACGFAVLLPISCAAALITIATTTNPPAVWTLESAGWVRCLAADGKELRRWQTQPEPLALTADGDRVWVACGGAAGQVVEYAALNGTRLRQWAVGHTPCALALSPDRRDLAVANRFDGTVTLIRLLDGLQRNVPVLREPMALAFEPNRPRVWVGHAIPVPTPQLDEENPLIAVALLCIDVGSAQCDARIELPNGSHSVRSLCASPDGRYLAVPHVVSRFWVPTWSAERGAMNRNALTIIDLARGRRLATLGLDDEHRGAANPAALAFLNDTNLLVAHLGTDELSLLDWPQICSLAEAIAGADEHDAAQPGTLSRLRHRIAVPLRGPQALSPLGPDVWIASAFSDQFARYDSRQRTFAVLDGIPEPAVNEHQNLVRRGEAWFHDARLGPEQWHSCATCHPDGRSDGLYWDLLNDGVGTTKDTKSLVLSHRTSPAMWRGVRADFREAIRAGIRHMHGLPPTPDVVEAIATWISSLKPVPSPALMPVQLGTELAAELQRHHALVTTNGGIAYALSEAARRGRELFMGKAGCAQCHPPPLYTNQQLCDSGLGGTVKYDVPTLIEVWRTAPYLHEGQALTLREAILDYNPLQRRGRTRELSNSELADLIEFVRSL